MGVLFYKDKHADMEVYNDYNSELVNLFRCVKYHRPELQRELSYFLNAREMFEDFLAQFNIRGMTDIQRAARFFMVLKTSYGSNQKNFGCVKKNIHVMCEYLDRIEERLSTVVIENKDFEGLIKVYDKPDALIYLDPPYYGTERYYQAKFSTDDHIRLNNTLQQVKGKFLLSYNDCEYIREMYKNFTIEEIHRNHNLINRYGDKNNTYCELLIKNY
ncbi:DNA adenine methylase [Petroclostridium sp. X23]|uniref:DNA adenine methylase n=1 Tax=Petroclostridium sp. X23 TaxID=3045146 RepID=UPI0032BFE8B6